MKIFFKNKPVHMTKCRWTKGHQTICQYVGLPTVAVVTTEFHCLFCIRVYDNILNKILKLLRYSYTREWETYLLLKSTTKQDTFPPDIEPWARQTLRSSTICDSWSWAEMYNFVCSTKFHYGFTSALITCAGWQVSSFEIWGTWKKLALMNSFFVFYDGRFPRQIDIKWVPVF